VWYSVGSTRPGRVFLPREARGEKS
jgi:hypothetical protein